MFRISCEEKIPFALEAFRNLGDVTICKGNRLTAEDLKCVDVLMIRSGTRVDAGLLDGTPVRFVASPTAGTDHIDLEYLERQKIAFYNAPGCNAESVVEYVIAGLVRLAHKKRDVLRGKTVGIVGVGNVGSRLAPRLSALGMHVLINDPPLAEVGGLPDGYEETSLHVLLERADVVTLHTPLVWTGAHPTRHLIGEPELRRMKSNAWLVNASRGPVVSNGALKEHLLRGGLGGVVLDVWEHEPEVDPELLDLVDIGTAHIAGYSYDGKVNGTIQVYHSFTAHYGVDGGWDPQSILAAGPTDRFVLPELSSDPENIEGLRQVVNQLYDIEADDRRMCHLLKIPAEERAAYFWRLRKEYPRRRSFHWHTLPVPSEITEKARTLLCDGLGLSLS